MLSAKAAFRFLRIVIGGGEIDTGRSGMGVLCFPLVGLVVGIALVLINRIIEPYLSSEVLSVVFVTILILATGGRHVAGTHETFDGLSSKNTPADTGRHQQIYGLVAVLLVVLFKMRSIEVIGESRGLSLLLAPLLARWSLVLFLFGSITAPGGTAERIGENVRSWHVVVATAMTLGLALFIAGAQALWIALCLSLFALVARSYLHRREGGISLANCGALIELGEAFSFTLFASL